MDSEREDEPSSIPNLPLFSLLPRPTTEPSGILTPPLQTSASVPFLWEEQPGKPRPCTALITFQNPKCLDLPPRLLSIEPKTPSPTTVLDAPFVDNKPVFSSFRFVPDKNKKKKKKILGLKGNGNQGIVGNFDEEGEGSLVFSPSMEVAGSRKVKMGRVKRNGSFSSISQTRSHLWATIYEGFKQAIPWKGNKKCMKERLNIVV